MSAAPEKVHELLKDRGKDLPLTVLNPAKRALADWLLGYRWDFFITLTYGARPNEEPRKRAWVPLLRKTIPVCPATRARERTPIREETCFKHVTTLRQKIMGKQGDKFFCFAAVQDRLDGNPHIHLLATNLLVPRDLWRFWGRGIVHRTRLDASDEEWRRRAVYYILKQIRKHPDSWMPDYVKGLHRIPIVKDATMEALTV